MDFLSYTSPKRGERQQVVCKCILPCTYIPIHYFLLELALKLGPQALCSVTGTLFSKRGLFHWAEIGKEQGAGVVVMP